MLLAAEHLYTGEAVLSPGWLEITDGRVVGLGEGQPPAPAEVDAPWLAPGLVDVHCHGGGGAAFDGGDDAVATALHAHRSRGTTTTVASLVTASTENLIRQVENLAGWVERGELAGIHLEGPWLAPERKGAHDPGLLAAPEPSVVEQILQAGRGTVKMVTLAPELPYAEEATALFARYGVVVAVGHTAADYATTKEAIEWGATGATHLFNAMPGLQHREPGPVLALMRDPRVWLEIIADGIHLDAELAAWVLASNPGRVVLITDAMAAAGFGDGDYLLGNLEVTVRDGVARLVRDGAIAGSTLILAEAVRRLYGLGVPAEQVLAAATVLPSTYLSLDAGRLAVGGVADVVVLDAQLGVQQTMRHGEWIAAEPLGVLR